MGGVLVSYSRVGTVALGICGGGSRDKPSVTNTEMLGKDVCTVPGLVPQL